MNYKKKKKKQITEDKSNAGSKIHDNNKSEKECVDLPLEGEVLLGELILVKLHENLWWSALV